MLHMLLERGKIRFLYGPDSDKDKGPAMGNLVLARTRDESITIEVNNIPAEGTQRIQVTVLGVDRGRVTLGVKAPGEIVVYRSEASEESIKYFRQKANSASQGN